MAVIVAVGAAALAGCAPTTAVSPTQTAPRGAPPSRPVTSTATTQPATTQPATTAPATTAPATTAPAASAGATAPPTPAQPQAGVDAPASLLSSAPGRYGVLTETLPLVDASRPTVSRGRTVAPTRALTTLVWRPAAPGRWPLIVFSHGFEVGPTPYTTLLAGWASAGYVVAAPEFPLTDQAVAGANLDEDDIQQQPADVRFVTDTLVSPATPLAADIDRSAVVFAGHSDGAETALAAGIAAVPPGQPAPRAVLAMSVSPLVGVTATANPPILVTQGDADPINAPAKGMEAWAEASAPKWYLDLHGAGHLPPLEAGSQWLRAVDAATLTFFHLYLFGGDPAALRQAGTTPGLTSIEEG